LHHDWVHENYRCEDSFLQMIRAASASHFLCSSWISSHLLPVLRASFLHWSLTLDRMILYSLLAIIFCWFLYRCLCWACRERSFVTFQMLGAAAGQSYVNCCFSMKNLSLFQFLIMKTFKLNLVPFHQTNYFYWISPFLSSIHSM
jgi:hypothetical protein